MIIYNDKETTKIPKNIILDIQGKDHKIVLNDFENDSFTACVVGAKKSIKNADIETKIEVGAHDYRVIYIADNAFKNKKKLARVTIPKHYIKSIGKKAFYGAKNLKKVIIKTAMLEDVGSKAFTGTSKKLSVVCMKSKLKSYKKMIKKAGAPKTTKYVGKNAYDL